MVEVVAIATIVLGVIGITVDMLLKIYGTGPLSTIPAYSSRCEWQSDNFMWKCKPKCLPGWPEFYDATPDMVNRSRGSWGSWAGTRGGTRRLCCQKHIHNENWGGQWFSTVKAGEANFFTNHGKYDTWIKIGQG
ncbi:hypothetical protein Ddc_15496 [Ditylenchus destructor]|nr:hypothetical protein Ddc_15496 [Ditylenchus destructor]